MSYKKLFILFKHIGYWFNLPYKTEFKENLCCTQNTWLFIFYYYVKAIIKYHVVFEKLLNNLEKIFIITYVQKYIWPLAEKKINLLDEIGTLIWFKVGPLSFYTLQLLLPLSKPLLEGFFSNGFQLCHRIPYFYSQNRILSRESRESAVWEAYPWFKHSQAPPRGIYRKDS